MLHEGRLATSVPCIHGSHLRQRHVGLVDEQQEVIRKKIVECIGWFSGLFAGEWSRVVFDPWTMPKFGEHLDVVSGSSIESLGFQDLPFLVELFKLSFQFAPYFTDGASQSIFRGHKVFGGVDKDLI